MLRLMLAATALCLCSSDAFAFGKNGKGLFGWRGGASPSGSCGSATPSTGFQASGSCASGDCGPQAAFPAASVGVKTWVNESGVTMVCDANGCRPAARTALVAGVNCPCVAANGYCPCASAMNQKVTAPAEPPKSIQAYGRTYTLVP